MDRRQTLSALLAATLAPATSWAQDFPSKPIKLVVAFGAGSGNDLIARELAKHMSESMGQPVVVENRPGAGGALGTDVVAKAPPDGHTIGLGTSSQLVMNVGLYKTLPFYVERDLRSIGVFAHTPLVITEGNYLLLQDDGWAPVADLLDEVWYLQVDPALRLQRLAGRHEQFGRSREQALAWIATTDEPNARRIEACMHRAHRRVAWNAATACFEFEPG